MPDGRATPYRVQWVDQGVLFDAPGWGGPSRLSRPEVCELCGGVAEFLIERADLSDRQRSEVEVDPVPVCHVCVSETTWGPQ